MFVQNDEKVAEEAKAVADAEAEISTAGPAIEAALENYKKVLDAVGERKSKTIVDKAVADADAMRTKVTNQATQLNEQAALAEVS